MKDTQVSKPVLILLVVVVVLGGGYLFMQSQSSDEPAPPPPAATQPTGATGATAGATGPTGEAEKMTAAERRAERRRKQRAELRAAAKAAGMPLNVFTALRDGKAVLIFFWNSKAEADQHANQAVKEVAAEHPNTLVVIREPISNKSRYQGIAKVTEITRTPGIVVLNDKMADAWQGYIDGVALNSRVEHVLDQD